MNQSSQTSPAGKARRGRHPLWAIPLGLALTAAVAVWIALTVLENWAATPFGETNIHDLTIQPGASARSIASTLESRGLVSDDLRLLAWLRLHERTAGLQAGEYQLATPISPQDLIQQLGHGVFTRTLKIPEGWTARQIAGYLNKEGWIAAPEVWLEIVARPLEPDMLGEDLPNGTEGYCFPETYDMDKSASAEQIHTRMIAEFKRQWTLARPEERDPLSAGLSMAEVVTLASMIQREARLEEEMPMIASVYLNRLKKGMKMQCCATVRYALGEVWDRALTYADLKVDSPYNTYLHAGLPPSPIANPGRAAIEAVLRPAQTDYIYYVYRGGGRHIFSQTYRQHEQAIRLARQGNPEAAITGQDLP